MRKIPVILLAAICLFSCKTEEKKETVYNDLLIDNLKGDVLTVESTPYKVDSLGKTGEMDSCCVTLEEYDSKGYIIKITEKEKSGKIKSGTNFTHFDNGLMKEIVNTNDGKPSGKLTIELDSSGKYHSAIHYDSAGKMDVFYKELEQDKYGNVIKGNEYKPDSTLKQSWNNKYKDQFFVGGETTDSSGKSIYTSEIKLNDKGDRISFSSTSMEKDSTVKKSYTYEYGAYDDKGNWTERTEMKNGKPSKVIKRSITYAKKE